MRPGDPFLRALSNEEERALNQLDRMTDRLVRMHAHRLQVRGADLDWVRTEVLEDAWRSIRAGRGPVTRERLTPWLGKIVRDRCADVHRRRARAKEKIRRLREVLATKASQDCSPDPPMLLSDADRLEEALNALAPRYRRLIELYFFEGLDYDECARRLRLGVEALRKRMERARSKLREVLRRSWEKD
ncbi:MAG TPA: sigma-70 family RNA polymerase sigma factor [Planctomycetota bacterium]|nr:sigma-70 family RNA polymerase sigma factor [Planctomycetota bacterium]